MKILITGATGLIGTRLVDMLLQNGVSINYLTTSKDKIKSAHNYKGFYWNPNYGEIDATCLEDVTTIIHLAGASVSKRWTNSHKEDILNSRVFSTRLLHQAISKNQNNVTHIISASAIGIYPDSLEKIYHEDEKSVDNSFLGEVTEAWEKEVDKLAKLNITISKVRTGLVLAKNGGALQEMLKPIKLGLGAAFGTGKQCQSWIHIDDLVAMYYFIAQNGLEGVYNGVAPYPVSNKNLTKAIAAVLQKPLFLPNIPKFLMKLILGEMHIILFSSQNVSATKILDKGFQFKFASLQKALENLLK